MNTVILKNGSEEVEPLVIVATRSLKMLIEENPIAFYELVEKCRDRNHVFFGNTGEILKNLSLVQSDGRIHESVKNVVLSSVSGDGFDMVLGSPV